MLCLSIPITTQAEPQVEIEGLLPNAAIVLVDGERKMLKVGQTFKGVTLIASYTRTATLEVGGKQTVLGLSRRVGANYHEPAEKVVTIHRDKMLQYQTTAKINGRPASVLVDTGANVVALSRNHARTLGVTLDDAPRVKVDTAGGVVNAWTVILRSIDVGGIRVDNVQATVVDGDFPAMVLLGMSYLRHVKLQENQGVMTLSRMQ